MNGCRARHEAVSAQELGVRVVAVGLEPNIL